MCLHITHNVLLYYYTKYVQYFYLKLSYRNPEETDFHFSFLSYFLKDIRASINIKFLSPTSKSFNKLVAELINKQLTGEWAVLQLKQAIERKYNC